MKYKAIQRMNPQDRTKSKWYASPVNDGKSVNLGELGTLRVSFGSEGVETEAQVGASKISGVKIIFTPGAELKKSLAGIHFEKVETKPADNQPGED
jgi:hypothetical protein